MRDDQWRCKKLRYERRRRAHINHWPRRPARIDCCQHAQSNRRGSFAANQCGHARSAGGTKPHHHASTRRQRHAPRIAMAARRSGFPRGLTTRRGRTDRRGAVVISQGSQRLPTSAGWQHRRRADRRLRLAQKMGIHRLSAAGKSSVRGSKIP